jgi:hypothetical protein
MANANLTTLSSILTKVIHPVLQRLMAKKVIFLDKIKKNVRTTIANDNVYISAAHTYHSGFYFVAEGTQPKVGRGSYIQMQAALKFGFMTYGFTDQALTLAAKQGKQAIAGTFDAEFETGLITAKKHMNRILHGDGNGKLCLANGAGSSTTALVVDGCPAVGGGTNHTKYLAPGQHIHIGTTAAEISTVDSDTGVTLASPVSWSDNDVITLLNDAEPMGLAGHIDDGDNVATYQNLSRTTYPILKAQVDDTAEALTEADMIAVVVKACEYGDGPDVGLTNQDLWQKFGALLLSMKRSVDMKDLIGGWKGLVLNVGSKEIPIICDYDTWDTYVQFPRFGGLTIADASDMWEWMAGYDGKGDVLRRSPDGRTDWEGTQKWYMQLCGLQVNDMARLKGKTT